ncbi:MAG: hypothetical protein C4526_07660 [Nitrospiraceae bacterium]|nr:MAG: hypothetical protein C4526_07660 [Nitrospiraceae bacterium]
MKKGLSLLIIVLSAALLLCGINLYAQDGSLVTEGGGGAPAVDTGNTPQTAPVEVALSEGTDSGSEKPSSGEPGSSDAASTESVATATAETGGTVDLQQGISDFNLKPLQISPAGNSGTAVTGIPIIVPPGRKGMQPNISLNYSSSGGNGWLGVGWSLDMGAIQRNTKRGVNYSADDFVVTVNGSSSELVYIGTPQVYQREYRTKIEGAFSRYIKRFDCPNNQFMIPRI